MVDEAGYTSAFYCTLNTLYRIISSKLFHRRVATLLVLYQTSWQYSNEDPPNMGVECRWGMQKSDSRRISGCRINEWWSANNNCDRPSCSLPHTDRHTSLNLCSSQPAWTTTMKRREQNLFVRSGKFEAEVTNNRRLRST